MLYAKILNNTISRIVPDIVHFDDGRWWDFRDGLPADALLWKTLVVEPRPADTATHTYDESIILQAGIPTVVWIQRPKTQAEIDAAIAAENKSNLTTVSTLQSKIDALKTFRADPQVTATLGQTNNTMPAASQINQYNKANIRHQRRQDNLLITLAKLIDPSLLLDISDTSGEA